MMRLMGMDVGDKWIGLALPDKEENIALPLKVLKNDAETVKKLENLIEEYSIGKVVVGMPYTLKGEMGEQAKKVIGFVDANLRGLNIEIEYEDERFTSKIIPAGKKGKDKKKYIDMVSAGLILQSYLDRRNNKIDNK